MNTLFYDTTHFKWGFFEETSSYLYMNILLYDPFFDGWENNRFTYCFTKEEINEDIYDNLKECIIILEYK